MIDLAKLKEIVAMMKEHDLSEVDIKWGDETLKLRRGPVGGTTVNHQPVIYQGAASGGAPVAFAAPAPQPAQASAGGAPAAPAPAPAAGSGMVPIESPMVGTCYLAPNPDAAPFAKVGQSVTPDTVVCLIEAMKVFNEIKAEKSGVIEQILVKNGQAVEFGQKLFAIRPA